MRTKSTRVPERDLNDVTPTPSVAKYPSANIQSLNSTFLLAGLISLFFVIGALPVQSQDPRRRRSEGRAEETKSASATNDGKVIAIVGGDVYTVTHEIIRRGTVLVKGSKILRVGQNLEVPAGATVIDARGKYITPGFVALDMSGIGLNTSGGSSANYTDSLDPFDQNIKLALGVGITCGSVELGSRGFSGRRRGNEDRFLGFEPELPDGITLIEDEDHHTHFEDCEHDTCVCCGLAVLPREPIEPRPEFGTPTPRRYTVLKMSYGRLEPMLIEVPTFFDPGRGALSGALARYSWRQGIENARKYVTQLAEFERALRAGQRNTPPQKTASDEMIALVKKEVALRVQADSVDEIRDMIALAKELDYRLVLDSVAEGWLIANELGEADVPVAITPRNRRRPRPGQENTSGSSIESSKIFEQSGVKFAVTALSNSISLNGLAGRDLSSLPLEAAFAIRGGCSESTALAAITIVPARLMGLGNRLGSIEEGKDADLLILNGPPLDYRTYVETALVSGNVSYERAKDRVYPVFERN